jgi:hypothetical protein
LSAEPDAPIWSRNSSRTQHSNSGKSELLLGAGFPLVTVTKQAPDSRKYAEKRMDNWQYVLPVSTTSGDSASYLSRVSLCQTLERSHLGFNARH